MHDHIWQGIGSTIALRKNSSTYWEMSRETLEEGLKLLRLNTPASQAGLASLDDQIQACMHDFVDLYIYICIQKMVLTCMCFLLLIRRNWPGFRECKQRSMKLSVPLKLLPREQPFQVPCMSDNGLLYKFYNVANSALAPFIYIASWFTHGS